MGRPWAAIVPVGPSAAADSRHAPAGCVGNPREVIGIVGCGRMGSALAAMFAAAGFTTRLASRYGQSAAQLAGRLPKASAGTVECATANSDLIVLAAPVSAICEHIAPRIRPLLRDRVLIDVSNPGFASGLATEPADRGPTSAAERIASALATDRLVKALNCVAARSLAESSGGSVSITVPIAGDNPEAKDLVTAVLEPLGFDVADAGPLSTSRWLEGLSELLACLGRQGNASDRIGFRLVRLPPPSVAPPDDPERWNAPQQRSRGETQWQMSKRRAQAGG
jgi:8-hydroxy-5-deazaflavin:NADPH oxidoreductase